MVVLYNELLPWKGSEIDKGERLYEADSKIHKNVVRVMCQMGFINTQFYLIASF